MSDADATVQALRDRVARFVHERAWERYHTPKDLALALNVEAAELLELFLWSDTDPVLLEDAATRSRLEEELADVLIYCLDLANAVGLDLSDAVLRKMDRNERKYPASRYRGRARLEGPPSG
jgi:NTP pyrophosphatase (non-canonical NTP hydrolase)